MNIPPTTTVLRGLTVLLTRSRHQAQGLQDKISQQGGHAVLFPSINIVDPADKEALAATIQNLAYYDLVIFVSPNAVLKTVDLIQNYHRVWPKMIKIAAIGSSTAKTLRQSRLPIDYVPQHAFNSQGLLALPALQAVVGCKLLIIQGEGGLTVLANTLQQRGAEVSIAIAYRRTRPSLDLTPLMPYVVTITPGQTSVGLHKTEIVANALDADVVRHSVDKESVHAPHNGHTIGSEKLVAHTKLAGFMFDIIVVTSQTGLDNLYSLFPQPYQYWLRHAQLLVISPRLAVHAQALGFVKPPVVADNATDEAIVQALRRWQATHAMKHTMGQQH